MNSDPDKAKVPLGDQIETTFGFRRVLRQFRNWSLIMITFILLIDTVGAPNVMWSYRYQGDSRSPFITEVTYYGPFGRFETGAYHHGQRCPWLIFVRPEPSATKRLCDLAVSTIY